MPDMDINLMLIMPKLSIGVKKTVQNDVLVVIEKIVILDWNNGFLNAIFSMNFKRNILMILKFFMKNFL